MIIIRNDLSLKVQLKYKVKQSTFAVKINDSDYFSLPYVAPTSAGLDPEHMEILTAEVFINGHNVWLGSKYWDCDDLMSDITDAIGE